MQDITQPQCLRHTQSYLAIPGRGAPRRPLLNGNLLARRRLAVHFELTRQAMPSKHGNHAFLIGASEHHHRKTFSCATMINLLPLHQMTSYSGVGYLQRLPMFYHYFVSSLDDGKV
jgi:putative NADPH-quinone reductase